MIILVISYRKVFFLNFCFSQGRKKIDLTLSVRYSNLPNNAKLELVKAERSRAETDVTIALQLESGDRLQNTFSPAVSLWEVLQHCDQQTDV